MFLLSIWHLCSTTMQHYLNMFITNWYRSRSAPFVWKYIQIRVFWFVYSQFYPNEFLYRTILFISHKLFIQLIMQIMIISFVCNMLLKLMVSFHPNPNSTILNVTKSKLPTVKAKCSKFNYECVGSNYDCIILRLYNVHCTSTCT